MSIEPILRCDNTAHSQPLKIAYINDQFLPKTGTDTEQLMQTVSSLGETGTDIQLILPEAALRSVLTAQRLAQYYHVPPSFKLKTVKSFFPSFRVLEKILHPLCVFLKKNIRKVDIIYSRNLPTVIIALILTKLPVVYETYRPWADQISLLIPVLKWMARQSRMIGVITHSNIAASSFISVGFNIDKVIVAYNSYRSHLLRPALNKNEAREKIGIPRSEVVVVYTGHISSGKGLHTVLDVSLKLPQFRFLLVGSTGEGSVERRARKMANVTVYSWKAFNKMIPFLYAADILLIPPTRKPMLEYGHTVLPFKTFLYLAAGRAIVAPNSKDIREVLSDGLQARLVSPDDVGACVKVIRSLAENNLEMRRLAQNAKLCARNYTLEKRTNLILNFLHRQINKNR